MIKWIKKIIYVAVLAAVIIAAAAAAVFLLNNSDNGPKGDYSSFDVNTTKNLVFGNANNDNYLNQADVDMIQDIVNGKLAWDKVKFPLVDANTDGVVDSKDVALVKKFLNGESAKMYYMNWYKDVASVNYPVSGKVSVDYTTAYDMLVILGCLDDLVGTRDTPATIEKYNDKVYPGVKNRIQSIRTDAGKMDPEKMYSLGTKLVIGDPYDATPEVADAMHKMDPTCNVLELPVNRVVNGIYYSHTIVSLGVMMNRQSNTAEYVKYIENVESEINKKVAESKSANKTVLICYNPSGPNSINLDILATGASQYTDVTNVLKLPLTIPLPRMERDNGGYMSGQEIAKIMEIDPDVIVLDTYNLAAQNLPNDEYDRIIKEKVEYFKETRAYRNNMIITCAYEVIGGAAGISTLPLMGHYIWGDGLFTEKQGWDYVNEYYQKFTNFGKTVDMRNNRGYGPEQFGATMG